MNNNPSNLECVSAHVHWLLHLLQGDPLALNGKFIQGASEAGKIGGKAKKPNKRKGQRRPEQECIAIRIGIENKRRSYIGSENTFYGRRHTAAARAKISLAKRNPSPETRRKMSESAKARCSRKGI